MGGVGEAVRNQAYNEWLNMALTTAAIGGGARGLLGLYDTVRRNVQRKKTPLPSGQILMDIPYPREAVATEQQKLAGFDPIPLPPRRKYAEPPAFMPPQKSATAPPRRSVSPKPTIPRPQKTAQQTPQQTGWGDTAMHAITHPVETLTSIGQNIGGLASGDAVSDATAWPPYIPGMAVAGVGGAMGGYKLVDWLWNKHRNKERKEEVRKARQNYEQALLEEQVAHRAKIAEDLDYLYDTFVSLEKQATTPVDAAGYGLALPLTGGAMLGMALANVFYNRAKSRGSGEVLRRAQKERARLLSETRPLPLYARPISMSTRATGSDIDAAIDQEV